MGLPLSRNNTRNQSQTMSSPGRGEDDSESSDTDSDLATVLQYLIRRYRSGQFRLLTDQPDADSPSQAAQVVSTSNLENFHKTEIAHDTKNGTGGRSPISVTEMITRRQTGQLKTGRGFSHRERCGINNRKLPTKLKMIDCYECKAFCGVFNKTGDRLLTASQDCFLRLYDSSTGWRYTPIRAIHGRDVGWSILDAEFSPTSNSIAYSSWSTCLHLVDLDTDFSHVPLPLVPLERKFCIFSFKFSSSGDEILCGANDGFIYVYNIAANRCTLKVDAHDEDVNSVAFAAEDSTSILFSGSDDGLVKVWDRRTLNENLPKPVGVLAGHLDGVVHIDSRGDSRHLISNSKDQSIKLWDMRKFSSDEAQERTRKMVSSSRWDYRWQAAPRKLVNRKANMKGDTSLATYRGHSVLQTQIRAHFSPAFSTGQRYIYTGCAFGSVIIYDVLTGEIVARNHGHSTVVRDVSWHPFRNEIVSVSWGFSVACWNRMSGEEDEKEKKENSSDDEEPSEQSSAQTGTIWNRGRRRSCRLANPLKN